jgi:outer membrane protein, multidrug efflux system
MMMRISNQTRLLAAALPALLLSGCLVGPKYERPKVAAPPVFRGAEGTAAQASFADLPWWDVFKDDTLKGLIRTALVNNYDLRIASARVEQYRQLAAIAHSQYLPSVGYSGGVSGGRNQFFSAGQASSGTMQGAAYAVASAAWEPDIWGRIRRLNEAARAEYFATEQAQRGVILSLTSEVAQAYFELLGLQLQLQIAKDTVQSFDGIVKIFTDRFQGGVASKLDVDRAVAARSIAAADIPDLERQIALTENQISVLLGQNPGAIATNAKLLEEVVPPEIPAGLPSALLERRPDVLAAEQKVVAANARIGVATAEFFPKIGLTAFFGQASSPLSDFTSSQATAASMAASLAGPIYQGGALKANKRKAIAIWEEAKLLYGQAALNAFQDVSNTLVSRTKFDEIKTQQVEAVRAYQESVVLSMKRYIAGKASYFEVLEAQQQLFPAQKALAATELNRRVVIVQLYKALGGGWNLSNAQWVGNQPAGGAQAPAPAPSK